MTTKIQNKAAAKGYIGRMLLDKGYKQDLTTMAKKANLDSKDEFFLQLIIMDISGKTGYLFTEKEFMSEIRNRLGVEAPANEPQSE